MKRLHAFATLTLPLVSALMLHYGCGASDETLGTAGGAANGLGGGGLVGGNGTAAMGGSHAGGSGQGASGLVGGSGSGLSDAGDFDADFRYDAPPFDAGLEDACVDETAEAEPVPLDLYLMLDRSGSMGTDCNVGSTTASKWCYAINAIAGYLQDSGSNGNQAAIQYFPITSGGDNCNGTLQATPAVGLGLLTPHAANIITSMNGVNPNGGYTPIEPALNGLVSFTGAHEAPPRIMIGILITDGQPNYCNTTPTTLRDIIGTHFALTGIHTFIIGMLGANFTTLETIANYPGALSHPDGAGDFCGGTYTTCHHYNVGDGDPSSFIAALQAIQNAVLGCTFNIPQPSVGVLDPDLVSVEYYPGGSPPATTLPRRDDLADCNANGDVGWYYDDNDHPTIINLCSSSCSTVQGDPNAEVKIRIACQGS